MRVFNPPCHWKWCLALSLAAFYGGVAHAASVPVIGSFLYDYADNGSGTHAGNPVGLFTQAANPLSATQSAINGANSAVDTYLFSNSAFSISFAHAHTGAANSYAESFGNVDFSIQPDVPGGVLSYSISGNYAATDVNNVPGVIYITTTLTDLTTNTVLFRNFQESLHTPNQSFVVGQQQGDDFNLLQGNISGGLIAGHDYEWLYDALIARDSTSTANGATAAGNLTLTFADSSAIVPLPTAAASGMGLLAALMAAPLFRRRRARR